MQDCTLIKEAFAAVSGFSIDINPAFLGLMLIFIAALFLLGFVFRPLHFRVKGRIIISAVFLLAVVGGSCFYNSSFAVAREINAEGDAQSYFERAEMYDNLGFVYCFLYSANDMRIVKPADFDKKRVEQWIAEAEEAPQPATTVADGVSPHVFFIMGEAFCDITNNEVFGYNAENDPLMNYNAMCRSDRSVSGHLHVPGFGGGTSNTEFEVMTGMLQERIGQTPFYAFHSERNSVARVMGNSGYLSMFVHPGTEWFYNRQNVYRYFGFDELYFEESFRNPDYTGGYISDASLGDFLMRWYENNRAEGTPLFSSSVSIASHFPFDAARFPDHAVSLPLLNKEIDDPENTLGIYIECMRKFDGMLGTLIACFENKSDPVLLVVYGDHLPYLGSEPSLYDELGMVFNGKNGKEAAEKYEVPFVIWSNAAGAEYIAAAEAAGLYDGIVMNSSYLGVSVLDMIGLLEDEPYLEYVREMRNEFPVITDRYVENHEGKLKYHFSDEEAAAIDKLYSWTYYEMKYQ